MIYEVLQNLHHFIILQLGSLLQCMVNGPYLIRACFITSHYVFLWWHLIYIYNWWKQMEETVNIPSKSYTWSFILMWIKQLKVKKGPQL